MISKCASHARGCFNPKTNVGEEGNLQTESVPWKMRNNPALIKHKYDYPECHFIEVANDIRNIKNQLIEKIATI